MFDKGVFFLNEDMTLDGIKGSLQSNKSHKISSEFISYHRGMFKGD
jgi:hypothetical protein